MTLKLGELSVVLKTEDRPLDDGLAAAQVKTRAAGKGMQGDAATTAAGIAREWGRGGKDAGDAFVRDSSGRLRDSRGRFSSAGSELGDAVGGGISGALQSLGGAFSSLMGSLGSVTPSLGEAVKWIGMIAAAATFAAPAIGILGGALGSLPGIIGGLGALTGTLSLGFMGLGDAFKKTAGGGGSAGAQVVDTAYQIAQAERRLRDANEEVTASQQNLTKAREKAVEAAQDLAEAEEDAKRKMEDLSRSLTGARLDEEEAQLRITEAQQDYNKALMNPADPLAIKKANLALREAQNSAVDATARVDDLGRQQDEATAKGVEGSDEVKAAQDRYRDATDQVAEAKKRERNAVEGVGDAEHALEEARKKPASPGGGGGVAKEVTKLAPAAAAAVAAIKSLKPAFESLRLDVQEKLFKGVGDKIKEVAGAWLPTLHTRLGSMASTLNGLFKTFATSVSKKSFVDNMAAGMKSFEGLVGRVGKSVAGPFVDAWGRLSRAAGPFITQLGKELGGVVDQFSAWIKSADGGKSSKLEAFFTRAAAFLHEVFTIGRTVASIIGGIFSAIWGSSEKKDPLASFQGFLDKINVWVNNPENKKKIEDIFTAISKNVNQIILFLEKLGPLVGPAFKLLAAGISSSAALVKTLIIVIDKVGDAISWVAKNAPKWWDAVKNAAGKAKDWISDKWNALLTWFKGLKGRISSAAGGMWDGMKTSFKNAVNWLVGKWNNLSFTIGGGTFLGQAIPSLTLNTPDIPYLAQGGIVPATPGGRLAVVGEGGQDEAVLPLSKLQDLLGRMVLELRSSGAAVDDMLVEILRSAIKWRGGDVQVVLGQ